MKKASFAILIMASLAVGWLVGFSGIDLNGLFATAASTKDNSTANMVAGLCDAYDGLPTHETPGADSVQIPGGAFTMAAGNLYPEEGVPREVTVPSLRVDRHEVTNAQFAEFVHATGYVTVAERKPDPAQHPNIDPKYLVPGGLVFTDDSVTDPGFGDGWWKFVPGASWRTPFGPSSSIDGKDNLPVVQVTIDDARAYAAWKGNRLPTEAEWEFAARGGLDAKRYAWGDDLRPNGQHLANIWQGAFPMNNTSDDGFPGLSEVGCYPANGYGLVDMIGNAWELTETSETDASSTGSESTSQFVIKGGSYLCAANYCRRYRPAARQLQEADLASAHVGFRTVVDQD